MGNIKVYKGMAVFLVLLALGLSLLSANQGNTALAQATDAPIPEEPYYKCYELNRSVDLLTQFGLERNVNVIEKNILCAPALLNPAGTEKEQKKKLEKLEKRFPHLKLYGIFSPDVLNVVKKLNSTQFGDETVSVIRPIFLGLPVEKRLIRRANLAMPGEPKDDPHYKCYTILPVQQVGRDVTLRTQFGTEKVTVIQNELLCAPALKNPTGSPAEQMKKLETLEKRFPHLKLYSIRSLEQIQSVPLNLRTQFGTEMDVRITTPMFLAVPVKKS